MRRIAHTGWSLLAAVPLLAATDGVRVLDDFESAASTQRWEGPIALARGLAAHGTTSARVAFSAGYTRLSSRQLGRDWSGFDVLAFDIHSDSEEPKAISLTLYDEVGGDEGKTAKYDYFDANRKLLLLRGWNHFRIALRPLPASSTLRDMDLRRLVRLAFAASQDVLPLTIHLDNLRLIAGTEGAGTASRTLPSDAVTTITGRWFSVRQINNPEDVPESPRVSALRRQAEREAAGLRDTIRAARMQGLDTIYSERRLVVADLGLHVRPLLAWFNNDIRKAQMFTYVAGACRNERQALQRLLNSTVRMDEVDDTQPVKAPVPDLPLLRGTPSAGWFFRDTQGDPLMVISLHSSSVPLQRFFATPLQHIESYSVGGGSRWTIEDSPVYAAFQRYADTHRVGWDGWCGHLVKDLDSMGGTKRENVVICLESRHIREALEDYIRINIPKLRTNPNLLYNILAYELTYICYCDESRRMFAHWLRDKHGTIQQANALWGTHYTSFEQVVPPPTANSRPLPDTNRALWYDWARFNQDRFTQHLLWVRDTVRKFDPATPLAAGGSSSMLSGRAGVAGIDEERIVNEVDDVIIHEGGGSTMGLDLQVALSEHAKPIADPEMNLESVSNLWPHLLHGKSVVQLFHWPVQPPAEFVSTIHNSLPHSWAHSLRDIDDLLKAALDARRLRREIAAFVDRPAQVAILYSQTSTLQIPPAMFSWSRTPYLFELERVYDASRFLDVKTTFITERQIAQGKLAAYPVLLIPSAHALPDAVADRIREYVANGGVVLASQDSLTVDEYNHPRDRLARFGIRPAAAAGPQAAASGELLQQYDQTFSENVIFSTTPRVSTTPAPASPLQSLNALVVEGTHQRLALASPAEPAFLYPDKGVALAAAHYGKGIFYYAGARLEEHDYARLLDQILTSAAVKREFRTLTDAPANWKIESRPAALHSRRLQAITNHNPNPAAVRVVDARGRAVPFRELRSETDHPDGRISLAAGETVLCELR